MSKRVSIAMALDEFEETLGDVKVAWRVESTKSVQGVLKLKITDMVEQLANKYSIKYDDLFGEASMIAIRTLEDGASGRCNDYTVKPWIDHGRFVGHVLTFYKFDMIGGAA